MSDLPKEMIKEIIHFFVAYRRFEDSEFKAESLLTVKEVKKLIDKS